jgi:hypothetical protein
MAIKKHVGKIRSTDARCVIVFMQLPDDKQKALIIDVESLQPRYEQILLSVVDSAEGQHETDLASAMARRTVQETGNTVLTEFHRLGLMRAESIDNVIMLPQPNTPFALRDILQQLGKLDDVVPDTPVANNNAEVKYNPIVSNINAAEEEKRTNQAMNFIAEAEMLEGEANRKREQAYRLAPELRPAPRQVHRVDVGNMNPAEAKVAVEAAMTKVNEATLAPAPKKRGRKPKSASNG